MEYIDVAQTANKRFIEIQVAEEASTFTLLLTEDEALELRDGLQRELDKFAALRK